MDVKQIASFVKIEHTLFSLPFVFIGAYMAGDPTFVQLFWILIAAVGARGLAMGLNRIIDREIDGAANPRTANRHLVAGTMSLQTAWILCFVFLVMLTAGVDTEPVVPIPFTDTRPCICCVSLSEKIHLVVPLVARRMPCSCTCRRLGRNNWRNYV